LPYRACSGELNLYKLLCLVVIVCYSYSTSVHFANHSKSAVTTGLFNDMYVLAPIVLAIVVGNLKAEATIVYSIDAG